MEVILDQDIVSHDMKLSKDGYLMFYDDSEAESNFWSEHPRIQAEADTKMGREKYNKIIKALDAQGHEDLPPLAAPTIFEGTLLDYHKKGGGNLKKALNFDRIRWDRNKSGMKEDPILDYSDDDEVAASLEGQFKSVGFTFEAMPMRKDKVRATYKGKTLTITTNRFSKADRIEDEKGLINWMNAQINADPKWKETVSLTEKLNDSFDSRTS